MDNVENFTLGETLIKMGELMKKYEESQNIEKLQKEEDKLYGINHIIKIFPYLSIHIITKAINNGQLQYTKLGRERHFKLKDIEQFIRNNTKYGIINRSEDNWRNYD